MDGWIGGLWIEDGGGWEMENVTARTRVVKKCGIGGVVACIIPCNLSTSFGFFNHSCVSSFFIHRYNIHSFIHSFMGLIVC